MPIGKVLQVRKRDSGEIYAMKILSKKKLLQKKMLKKPLREDAGADVLRDSPCSAHVSG